MTARMRSSRDRQPYGLERSSPFTHRSTAALIYEPEILGFMHDTAVTFFPDNQSAYDIMSYDYAKRNHFEINSSTKGKLRTARGAMVNTLGTVSRPIRFAEESKTYIREFHVLPKCVHDIILGSPVLRLTQTFTKFRHRILNKLRGLSSRHRVCFTGSSQQMLAGWANGQSVLALPDTGSDICLMSAQYARERGYRVDTDPRHRQLLEFVDGSTAETLGRVEGFQWKFDKSDIQLHTPEIHVLEDLQTDLLLSYDFLMHTDAFSTHEELFVDIEPHDKHVDEMFGWLACAIKLVTFSKIRGQGWKAPAKLGLRSRSPSAGEFSGMRLLQIVTCLLIAQSPIGPDSLQEWHAREHHELTLYEERRASAYALSEPHRTRDLIDARVKWNNFLAEWPGCGKDRRCSARTPCRGDGCNYIPPATLRSGSSPAHPTRVAPSVPDHHPPDVAATSGGALPDPGIALSGPAHTPNTAGTNPPPIVDPLGTATTLALQGATTAPQAAAQTSTGRLTVWQTTSGLVRMFAKSKNKTLMTALLFFLLLHFGGASLL